MNLNPTPRWQSRLDSYLKALKTLGIFVEIAQADRPLNLAEEHAIVKSFEYTHELAWKVMKDFLYDKGVVGLFGSKDTTRESFNQRLITNAEIWMEMIQSRNLTVHTYDEEFAKKVSKKIVEVYYPELVKLSLKMTEYKNEESK
jgi:nucleotidyltransferase substrate binding protein (TIGR01987 family)